MKILKVLSLVAIGYLLHMLAIEVPNMGYQIRWTECVVKMHTGEVPLTTKKGDHYCLGTLKNSYPVYEQILGYGFNFWELYEEYITMPRLTKSYDDSLKKR